MSTTKELPVNAKRAKGDTYAEVITTLLEINKELTKQLIELTRELARPVSVPIEPPLQASMSPLHTAETEEDARYLYKTGQIDKEELEDALKEIGFFNSEIIVPS